VTLDEALALWPVGSRCRCGTVVWGWGAKAVAAGLEPCLECPPQRKPTGANLYSDGWRCPEHARAWWVKAHLLCTIRPCSDPEHVLQSGA
jgi:hypothetical protein